jgi:hypothetical protein
MVGRFSSIILFGDGNMGIGKKQGVMVASAGVSLGFLFHRCQVYISLGSVFLDK